MSGQDLVNKWMGKIGTLDNYDGVAGYQCVDVGKQSLNWATGGNFKGSMGDAITWWTNPSYLLTENATRIYGSNVVAGDIVIKRPNHEGIATGNVTTTSVEIIEQNGHTGTGAGTDPGDKIRTRFISRSDVAGLWRINALHNTPAPPTPTNNSLIGKTVHLSASVSSWRVYYPSTHTVRATLDPAKYGGLSYIIKGIDNLPNRVLIDSTMFGRVSLPIDSDATIS